MMFAHAACRRLARLHVQAAQHRKLRAPDHRLAHPRPSSALVHAAAACAECPSRTRSSEAYWYFRLRGRLAQLLTQPSIELLTQPSIALSERVTLTPQLAPTEVPVTVLNFPAENALQQSLTCSLASDPHFNFTSSTMLPPWPVLPAQNMNAAAE